MVQLKQPGHSYSGDFFLRNIITSAGKRTEDMEFWVVNKFGELLWSSNSATGISEISESEIFSEFVNSPFNKGLKQFNWKNEDYFGVFSVVEDTNLIFFATAREDVIMAKIEKVYEEIGLYVLFGLIVMAIFIQSFLYFSMRPLTYLANMSKSISKGEFLQNPKWKSFGELKLMKEAVVDMGRDLYEREEKIKDLFQEKLKTAKLEQELAVTETIQNNLIPDLKEMTLPDNVDFSYIYRACDHSGGDWIGAHFFEKTNNFVLVVADVVGHGVGSAMYTASISGVFETFIQKDDFEPLDFLKNLNTSIYKLGKGNWPATLGLMSFDFDKNVMTYCSMAHQKPYYIDSTNEKRPKVKQLGGPSDLLGTKLEPSIHTTEVELHSALSFWIATDGISEAQDKDEELFGDAAVKKALRKGGTNEVHFTLTSLIENLDQFRQEEPMKDDICIAGLKFVS